jgi:phosphate transport system permease protein
MKFSALKTSRIQEKMGFFLLFCCIFISLSFLVILLYFIVVNGISVLSWSFLTEEPRRAMTAGGVAPAIVGTFYLTILAILFSLPLGVCSAIYLNEYASKGFWINLIRLSISNLAGVPSVVFGLFGLLVFVKFFGFGISILSGSLTLSLMILPSIITASQEALQSVPNSIREGSLALGATKSQTIAKVVLPNAVPGILTGVILSIGRSAGETAPIMFTAVAFYKKGFPTSIMNEVMALPYHIYALMTEGTKPDKQTAIAFGCAFILMILVVLISFLAIVVRQRQRRKFNA